VSGSPEAAAAFLDRVGSWTDGAAAQLSRATPLPCRPTREIAIRLRHELELLARGKPVAYLAALAVARRNVIEDLLSRPPGR